MPDFSDDDLEAMIDENVNQNLIRAVGLFQVSERKVQVIWTNEAMIAADNYACYGGRPVEGYQKWYPLTKKLDHLTGMQVLGYMDAFLRAKRGLPPVVKR
ncbi:unnamed protein product [Sphagnum jensenii]|uniref:Uncharacterized protein n=1 Tax=Sphagnum jensenii TaxID=128206 RepID=A0ABP0VE45_9BRYO